MSTSAASPSLFTNLDPERASLLPSPTSSNEQHTPTEHQRMAKPSTTVYLRRSLLSSTAGVLAQVGLAVAMLTLWIVLWKHPAGLFSYHPAFQSLAIIGFAEGVLLLQPPPSNQAVKQKGLQLHQIFQWSALPLILLGAFFIIYNKAIHAAKHFTTWHGLFGLITLCLILLQITFGAFVVYAPLTSLLGGEARAKGLWKWHRMTGYTTLALLFVTPLLALDSDWLRNNSSAVERALIGGGLGATTVGVVSRISLGKLGLAARRT